VCNAITDSTRRAWSTTVLTDRTEEAAQSAVHLRQMGCTMLRRTTQSRVHRHYQRAEEEDHTANQLEKHKDHTQRHHHQPEV
jgi:ABC-type nickel/cobalt efflux system permease component RcnA